MDCLVDNSCKILASDMLSPFVLYVYIFVLLANTGLYLFVHENHRYRC